MQVRQVYYNTNTESEANTCNESVSLVANCDYHTPFKRGGTRMDFGIVYVLSGEMDFYVHERVVTLHKGEFITGSPHDFDTYFGTKGNF